MKSREARRLALSLPEATEQDHHGFPSFRVRGKIFATLPDDEHLNVMLGAADVTLALAMARQICEEVWWGKRLAGVRVELPAADSKRVGALLRMAWEAKAPRRLVHPARP
jgi:hypothetical protein